MQGNANRGAIALTLFFPLWLFLAGAAATAEKPYKPSWKYHTHHVGIDVQADGTTTTHYEYAWVVLDESAKESVADQDISYHENNGSLEDVVAYTLKADGSKLPLPETNVQVTSHNGVNGAPPAFSDRKNRNLIFPNVEVGDTVVLSYTLRNEKPTFNGYFSLLTHFSEETGYDDAQLVITAPRSLGLKYKSYNLAEPQIGSVDGNRQRWTWTYRNAEPRDGRKESSQFERVWRYADSPTVEISNFHDYRDIAAAYEVEAARRARVSDRIRALAAEITQGAGTPRERAEKIYKWTTKEITFAGNCLTGGDVVPRDTDLVLNMKMGDCKDHATLLQALLAAERIDSTQVLINAGEQGYEVPAIPCWQAFNHVINYVPAFGVYLDATSPSSPFGMLPPSEYGKPAIRTSAYAGVERIPVQPGGSDWSQSTDQLTILADGSIEATASYRFGGTAASAFSHRFTQWKKSPNFDGGADQIKRAIEGRGFKGGGAYENIADEAAEPNTFAYAMRYHVDAYLDTDSPYGLTLASFFPSPGSLAFLVSYAAAEPYDHDFLCHGDRRTEALAVTFPANVQLLAIPKDTHVETDLLQFDARYERTGNTIRVTRTVVDKSPGPICAADVSKQYAQIGAAIKKDLRAQAVYQPK